MFMSSLHLTLRNGIGRKLNKIGVFRAKSSIVNKKLPSATWIIVLIVCIALVVWLVRALLAAFP